MAPVVEQGGGQAAGGGAAPATGTPSSGPAGSPAVVALLNDAQQQAQAGHRGRAVAVLERALRIEPRNPVLWHRLASLRLQQQRYGQAESLALKSNSLAGSDEALRARNWQVIAEARQGRGDSAGARRAYDRARRLNPGLP